METSNEKPEPVENQVFYLAHEIRRPIANLLGLCEILKRNDIDDIDKTNLCDMLKATLEQFDQVLSECEIFEAKSS